MKRNRIRVHFISGAHVDIFGYTLKEVNKDMAVENDEMVTFRSPNEDKYYIWRRKHIKDWEVIEEQSDGIIPGKP